MINTAPQDLSVGRWISIGWRAVTGNSTNFWNAVLMVLIYFAAMFIAGLTGVGSIILGGVATAAVYFILLSMLRTGKLDINRYRDVFTNQTFVQTLLCYLVLTGFMLACYLVFYLPMVLVMFGFGVFASQHNPSAPPSVLAIILMIICITLLFCSILVIQLLYLFPLILIADRGMQFWPAMEASRKMVQRHFGTILLLMLATLGINLLGVIACCVGSFVTIPVTWTAIVAAYRDLWPEEPAITFIPAQTPPPPMEQI